MKKITDNEKERKKLLKKIYWNIIGLTVFGIVSYGFIDPWLISEKNDITVLIGILYLPISFLILMLWVWRISKLFHKLLNM
jgi:hypothetical protein